MRKSRVLIFLTFFFACLVASEKEAVAQKEKRENVFLHPKKFYRKFFPTLRIKRRPPPDTLFIKAYPNDLSVRMHMLSPSISWNVRPAKGTSSGTDSFKFKTNIHDIVGFAASYRFISAGFAFLLKSGIQTNKDYADSHYRTATIKYATNSYQLQYKFLKARGFTDINHAYANERFAKRPDIVSKEFQFEGLYNFDWKKYSYIAPFSVSHRQIKSRVGPLLKAGVYYNEIRGEWALIDPQYNYENFDDINVIRTFCVKVAPGVGGNLIRKNFYFSVVAFPSYDFYSYKYVNSSGAKKNAENTFVFNLDCKANLGYQSKRFYAGIKYEFERREAFLRSMNSKSVYSYAGLELGYRFRTPRIVKKVYKETMPPGM